MHVTVVDPSVADMVTISPATLASVPTAGLVSDVRLSVEEVPSSDKASRSGVIGCDGDAVSIIMVVVAEMLEMLFWLSVR